MRSRVDGLGKNPDRAKRRAAALAAIDPDWNPGALGWTVDWQRQYTGLKNLLGGGARLTAVVPGVTWHGEDIGRWLATQRRDYRRLSNEQQQRLSVLGVKPARAARARKAAAEPDATTTSGQSAEAFRNGVQALAQYLEREGDSLPGRSHVEHLPDGTEHRTGVWIANQKQRRDRLHPDQLEALANLGIHWEQ
ncbi:helicase-associated protein [Actinobacteria bacterium OV450]|nr:helicase-associated protein [Actinobacteria bacterium OV450]